MLVNLSSRSVLVRVQAREHNHFPDALHVLQYRREGACANYPRRARPPRIWVRFPSPKLGQKFLHFLQNKLSKSDFLTGRKNSILIPTRNADGMWASIMSLQEQDFCGIRNSDNCGRRRGAARYRDLGLACPPPSHVCVGNRPLIEDKPKNVLARGFAPPR